MKNNIKMIQIPLVIGILLYGGFYSFCVYAMGVIILAFLFIKLGRSKKSKIVKNEIFYGMILLCIAAIISGFFAVDKGMAWLGVLRVLTIVVWMFYLMQFDKDEREEAIDIIPTIGGIMVIFGIISVLFKPILPGFSALFWQADRFGGTFQYSNTCALFLLVAILILAKKTTIQIKEQITFSLLLTGIFLTGSKGGILLLIPVLIWIFIKKKSFRLNGIIMLAILLIGGIIYGTLSGDFQNIGRIYTLFTNQSTLLGRLLYMKDALPLLIKNPLGLGYMGYHSVQSSIQTGVYTSMFVHNDWLQMALDFGWLFLIVVVVVFVAQLIKGKQDKIYKAILILIGIYSLMEFHLQYFSVVMMVFLLLDYPENTIIVNKKIVARENQIFAVVGMLVIGFFAVQSLLAYAGINDKALSMYPYDTQVKETILQEEQNKDEALLQAKEILKLNPYSSYSYNVLAYGALMDGRFNDAIDYKFKVVELKKYNMAEYNDFLEMLDVIQITDNSEYIKDLCIKGKERLIKLLDETKQNTSDIAYKLRDKPDFIQVEINE